MKLWERYGAAIFDLDGTLADSMGVWGHLCREWMEARGLAAPGNLEKTIALMTLDQSARYIGEAFLPRLSPGEIKAEWNTFVADKYKSDVTPKEGAVELLRALSEQGMPLALATSCFPMACEGFLRANRIADMFSCVVYTDEVGRDKTHPDIYLRCAERLGIQPGRCVVLEDLDAALQGARQAGMDMIAVYDSSCKNWERFRRDSRWAVASLAELVDGGNF